jgi:hypothetical protein
MAATVSNEEIVVALSTSERFPAGSPQLEIFTPFVGHLVEIVGEDRLDDIVELGSLCDVISRYVSWLAANDKFLGKLDTLEAELVKELYGNNLANQLKAMSNDPESMLAPHGLTPETFLVSDVLGLNEVAKELVRRGELTFAKLLTTSPAVFIPEPS